jgi:hypothetical protein
MQTSRTRLAAVTAATLALVISGTAAVSAHPSDREDFPGRGMGLGQLDGPGWDEMGGLGRGGLMRGPMGGMFDGAMDGFVRHETIYQTADGTVTRRTDMGTVASTGETSLEYTLATGETASVTTDDTTEIIALSTETVELGRRGLMRERWVPETVTLADLAADTNVVVRAESQADGSFLAQRILVRPAAETTADDATVDGSTDDAATGEAGVGSEITEVPASPAPADA